jgi:DNA polymerase-3 subunit alpha
MGQNLGFDDIMGAELHRMGIDSPMATMPVLDTCTEVTAKLLQLPGGRGGSLSFLRLRNCMNICLTNPFRSAQRNCRCGGNTLLLELIRRGLYKKTRCTGILF